MVLSEQEKLEIKKIIKSNKWYTFEEAESELRKHWQPENDKNGDYLTMKRSQIQKVLRSDIIGTYLEIHKRKKDQSDDEWFMKTLYGWSQKEKFFLDYSDGREKEYNEELHVFPKYDRLFTDSELEQSIILSSFDELLGDMDKVEMREIYEELYGGSGKGKTLYLMTEPYLFALKHEIERRQYPTRMLYLSPHSPKEILSRMSEKNLSDHLQMIVFTLIDEFIQSINDKVLTHQKARNEERQRFQEIADFLKKWKTIYSEEIQKLEKVLSNETLLEEFYAILNKFNQPFEYLVDEKLIKNKFDEKYLHENLQISSDELKKAVKQTIYSVEKYNLDKLESALSADTEFISKSAIFRHQISSRIHEILQNLNADSLLFSSLRIAGIE
ncbi:hypothetical protein [Streptococcus sp. Marseille-P7375]|uniref:hypothetical protein n=1 Tax=Streptococcus sp. Marseille-P7375 TaxID=2487318 RepID=UPI000A971CEC|nr:hypothetical protein [Streptococcus sp. Marseille-P7375]